MTGKWSLVSVVSVSVVSVAGSREIRNLSYHVQQGGSGTDSISAQVLRASGLTYQYGFIVVSLETSLHQCLLRHFLICYLAVF